jgi:hypothetical protein
MLGAMRRQHKLSAVVPHRVDVVEVLHRVDAVEVHRVDAVEVHRLSEGVSAQRGGFPASKARRGGSNRRKGPDEEFSVMTERYL